MIDGISLSRNINIGNVIYISDCGCGRWAVGRGERRQSRSLATRQNAFEQVYQSLSAWYLAFTFQTTRYCYAELSAGMT